MRHIHKARELKATMSISPGSSLGGMAATASSSSTGNIGSAWAAKKGIGFLSGFWGHRSKQEPPAPAPTPAPAPAPASTRALVPVASPGPAPNGSLPPPPPLLQQSSGSSSGGMAGGEPKQYAAFLSHYKVETGTESRLVAGELGRLLPPGHNKCFLDSDDVKDLRDLTDRVWAPSAQRKHTETRGITRRLFSLALLCEGAELGVPGAFAVDGRAREAVLPARALRGLHGRGPYRGLERPG
jgi:hypothetical protein